MNIVQLDLQYSFYEISEILKYMPIKYSNKLPESFRYLMNENKISNDFEYDESKAIEDQNILQETRTLLSILYRTYWCSDEQRKRLEEEDSRILATKYDLNNVFNSRKETKNIEEINNAPDGALIVYKESIFSKIINKIKLFFK